MEVIRAKTAGFCFGVKRAIDTVYEEINKNKDRVSPKRIYTYGPIIHNDEVIKDLESKGVAVLHSEEELLALEDGIIIIRSHGVSKSIYNIIEERKLICVDATCPFVKKIHKIVEKESKAGNHVFHV